MSSKQGNFGLARLLKKGRERAGLSQREVAQRMGYSTAQFVSNWERGVSSPPCRLLKRLATLYGVSAEELYSALLEESQAALEGSLRSEFKKSRA